MEVILEIPFFTLGNANTRFAEKELTWRFFTAKETLPTTQRVEFINKKEFAQAALDKNVEAFVMHVSFLSLRSKMTIHPAWEAQIMLLLIKKVTVPAEYLNFADIFSKKSVEVLPERIGINKHTIKLEDSKQPPYRLIYSIGLVELKILKTYIKTNLANSFI